jgi:hypothetical protein
VQSILRSEPALLQQELAALRTAVDAYFGGGTQTIDFGYRLRLGVKG